MKLLKKYSINKKYNLIMYKDEGYRIDVSTKDLKVLWGITKHSDKYIADMYMDLIYAYMVNDVNIFIRMMYNMTMLNNIFTNINNLFEFLNYLLRFREFQK